MEEFTERFGTYSNPALLKIINNPAQYQPAAVEAAKKILATREVTGMDIETERTQRETEDLEKEAAVQKRKELELKVKSIGSSIVENISPIQKRASTDDKIINVISVLFGLLSLYYLHEAYDRLTWMFRDVHVKWDVGVLFYFLPPLVISAATLFFYLRKKIGWALLSIYLSCSLASAVGLIIYSLTREPSPYAAIENLFPSTPTTTQILTILFLVITLWTICRKGVLGIFKIGYKFVAITIGGSVLFSALVTCSLFS
jgi:hypothetical protein